MASLELDPLFVKALRLLHSKNKDSADQLKQLLDDVLAQRKGFKGASSESKSSSSKLHSKDEEEKPKERKAEKHGLDKTQGKSEPIEFDLEVPAKKPRRDSPQSLISHSSEKSSDIDIKKEDSVKKEKESHKDKVKKEVKKEPESKEESKKEKEKEKDTTVKDFSSSDDEKSIDADDFAFGLGIACVVCKGFDVTSGNQLVECQECHTLYHQECHKPPVTEQDVNDPRFVWYCSRCSKSLKKMVSKPSKSKQSPTPPSKEVIETSKPVKSEPASLFSFRRVEPKVSSSKDTSNNSGAKPMSGLASLAANLSGKSNSDIIKSGSSKVEYTKSLLKPDIIKHSISKSDSAEKVSLLNLSKSGGKSPSESVKSSSKSSHESGKSSIKTEQSKSSSKSSSEQLKSSSKQSSDVTKHSSSKSSSESGKSSSKSSSDQIKSSSKSSSSSSSDLNKSSSKSSSDHSKSSSKLSSDSSKSSSKQSDPSKSSSKSSVSSSSSSSSSKQPAIGGAASVVNADKRLQMMKKKAAAKLQEKRTSLK